MSKELYLTYLAINQIHCELIDRLSTNKIYKQRLKKSLNEANKIMSDQIESVYPKSEATYQEIVKLGDALLNAIDAEGWQKVRVILEAIAEGEIQEV